MAGQCQKYASDCCDEYRTNAPAPLNGSTIFAKSHLVFKSFVHHRFRARLNIPPPALFLAAFNYA
jgi:hypothetical protein